MLERKQPTPTLIDLGIKDVLKSIVKKVDKIHPLKFREDIPEYYSSEHISIIMNELLEMAHLAHLAYERVRIIQAELNKV